jgi:hypothetical protein
MDPSLRQLSSYPLEAGRPGFDTSTPGFIHARLLG